MFKQAMIGLFTISVVAICWNNANAGCLQYRIVGGSNMCVKWSTAGVKCEVQIDGLDCISGETNDCTVTCTADTTNSVAFCQPLTGPAVRRTCPTSLHFTSLPTSPSCTTGNNHDGDDNDEGGSGQHCTASITLTNPDCSSCCPGETCLDVTPVTMDATAEVTVDESLDSFLDADCRIDPKKIQLNQSRPYNCTIPPPD